MVLVINNIAQSKMNSSASQTLEVKAITTQFSFQTLLHFNSSDLEVSEDHKILGGEWYVSLSSGRHLQGFCIIHLEQSHMAG